MGMFATPPAPFPAPGNPNANSTTPSTTTPNTTSLTTTTTSPAANPFGMFGGAGGAGGNPFDPDPALTQQFLIGGGFGGAGGFSGCCAPGTGGFRSAPAVPADMRPPEERFQIRLQIWGLRTRRRI
jgi:ubiquilin